MVPGGCVAPAVWAAAGRESPENPLGKAAGEKAAARHHGYPAAASAGSVLASMPQLGIKVPSLRP